MNRKIMVLLLAGVALLVLIALVAFLALKGDGEQPRTTRVLAPIDATEIRVLESFPPQYVLNVTAGLPNGCARADGHQVDRIGDTVNVRIYNTTPVGNVLCTAIYGTYELNIPLGSAFQSGQNYTVDINEKQITLRAQ